MNSLQEMYRTIVRDDFPETFSLDFGGAKLVYTRRSWDIGGERRGLRYGENPDQPAALYALTGGNLTLGGIRYKGAGQGLVSALTEEHMIQAGKHPGKTNLTDVDNGIAMLQYLHSRPAAMILKHNNPSGAAWSREGVAEALSRAYGADRVAAFGGAVVVNRPLDKAAAEILAGSYFEVAAAPDFEPGTLAVLQRRKNLRILRIPGLARLEEFAKLPFLDITSLSDGGLVLQKSFVNRIKDPDDFLPASATREGVTLTARSPTREEAEDLFFAWAVETGVTSNSVIFARDGATVAIGTGEQDRVGCVEIAIHKAYAKYVDLLAFRETGLSLYELAAKAGRDAAAGEFLEDAGRRAREAKAGMAGSVLVSDGFFPFRDGVDAALAQGVTAIAQPGGSVNDAEVIAAANEARAAMVFTGQRSFKH
ncbi:MAG: IMP cyclohydrolase [Desulfovibrio sp.]|jgi:phosphoribosylaminoimidazolecarboxamide formyltransferase/IMP cyclohydrolase|nr:IMP cyclohydrolase [Desulfovibrio sp.]